MGVLLERCAARRDQHDAAHRSRLYAAGKCLAAVLVAGCVAALPALALAQTADEVGDFLTDVRARSPAATLVGNLSRAIFSIAGGVFDSLLEPTLQLTSLFLAFYVGIQVWRIQMPFGPEEDPKRIGNDILKKLVQGVVVFALMQGSGASWWDYVFAPAIEFGIGLQELILDAADNYVELPAASEGGASGECVRRYINVSGPQADRAAELSDKLGCATQRMSSGIGIGLSLGLGMLSFWKGNYSMFNIAAIAINIIAGLALVLSFGLAMMAFVSQMMNAVIKLSLGVMLAPLSLPLLLFEPLRSYGRNILMMTVSGSVHIAMIAAMSVPALAALGIVPQLAESGGTIADFAADKILGGGDFNLSVFSVPFLMLVLIGGLWAIFLRDAAWATDALVGGSSGESALSRIVQLSRSAVSTAKAMTGRR